MRHPIVSIPGGEPLLHPEIDEIVAGLVARKKYVYLCTVPSSWKNHCTCSSRRNISRFRFTWTGCFAREHNHAVCREGVYDVAIAAIRAAIGAGFRVTTNTTLYDDADPDRLRVLFDTLMDLGVEGMMLSPGYSYSKAPDQDNFLSEQTTRLFRRLLNGAKRHWKFNQSPLFLEFLKGNWQLECTPWGNPTYNLFGWQKPCYLLDDGYVATFQELMESTDWDRYGRASGNVHCADCMVHCGYEPSAVAATFPQCAGLFAAPDTVWSQGGRRLAASHVADSPPHRLPNGRIGTAFPS